MADTLDQTTVDSPGWWLRRLQRQLDDRTPRFTLLDRYYTGNHPLPEGDERARELFRQFQRKARSNFIGLVVESVRERMRVVGFRSGSGGTDQVDRDAWRIWQANCLDAWSAIVHQTQLSLSEAYVIVGPGQTDPATPVITPEDPRQVTVELDPVDRRIVRAALKTWRDTVDDSTHAMVYLPDSFYTFSRPKTGGWRLDDQQHNTLGVVPVVAFINRPRLMPDIEGTAKGAPGMGEAEDVLDIQDRINSVVLDRLVVSKMQAYRQRWAKGIQTTDDEGQPLDLPFVPGVDLLWAVEDEAAEFGDFPAADIMPILNAAKEDIRQLAAISRTPPHYLVGELNNVNSETLKATETGLISKVNERSVHAGEAWERVMWLAGQYAGIPSLSSTTDTEVIWADPESRTVAELADAAVKKAAAGVPWRQRMVDLGYSPQEIDRMETERMQDLLLQQQLAPPAAGPGHDNTMPSTASLASHTLYEGQWSG